MTIADKTQLSELFHLLSNSRRRYVLRYLGNDSVVTTIEDLAVQIATWEVSNDDVTADRIESVRNSLVHCHLPKLADYGVIAFDVTSDHVELIEKSQFDSFLDVSKPIDISE